MELLKKTIKSGNASAVVLPKAWLDKRVRVELIDKTPETILYDVLEIIKPTVSLPDIIGIYLVGSYARVDQTDESDIDILIISQKTSKELIKKGNYEILIVSLDLLYYKLKKDLLPIGAMLKEARPLLNANFLIYLDIKVTKKNVRWYLETTHDRLKTIKESIDTIQSNKPNGKLSDAIAYSLILRLRTVYMIDCLKRGVDYKKGDFLKLVKTISGSLIAYERYVYAKGNDEYGRELPVSEGRKVYEYLKDYLKKIENSVRK